MLLKDIPIPAKARESFAHLLAKIPADAVLPIPTGYRVLVLQYIRPETSRGGIIYADQTKAEDQWQGRVGLVLAVGPDAWRDPDRYPGGPWAKVGDVVLWPKLDNASTRMTFLGGCILALLNDDSVCARDVDPMQAIA